MDERTLGAGDVQLAIAEAGAGGTPVLLLHGFTGAKEDFGDWLDRLAEAGYHAVAPDHRGHGGSGKPRSEGAYSLDIFAGDALALADTLGWDRFALFGHSMGGMVAQVAALRVPQRLTGLILMDTCHGPVEGVDPALVELGASVARAEGIDRLADLTAELDSPLTTEADQRVREERPGYVEFAERKMRASSAHMYAAMATGMLTQDDRLDSLASLDVPTLVLVGEQDRPFLGPSERMAKTIPGARLVVLPGAGHSPQFEAPEAWWAEVTTFLGSLGSPR